MKELNVRGGTKPSKSFFGRKIKGSGSKMFKSKTSSAKVGNRFKAASMKSSAISPSTDEFDNMMNSVEGGSKKKSMFSK